VWERLARQGPLGTDCGVAIDGPSVGESVDEGEGPTTST
jgi:hypothetical protein